MELKLIPLSTDIVKNSLDVNNKQGNNSKENFKFAAKSLRIKKQKAVFFF